jgi:hypothetical protein
MTIYTVHLPPDAVEPHEVAERAVFVKEGFAVLGFIFTGLWLLAQRLWLHALAYFAVLGLLSALFWQFGLPSGGSAVISLLLSILIGIEGNEAIRRRYERRGWTHAGTVSGPSLEECERRFFADWTADARTPRPAPPLAPLPGASPPAAGSGVLGVFPAPRGQTGAA